MPVISRFQRQSPKQREEWVVTSFDGLNNNDDPAGIKDGQSPDTLNTVYDNVGAIQTRKGYTKLLSTSLSNPIYGMFSAYKSDGTTKQLIYGSGTSLWKYNNAGGSTALTATGGGSVTFTSNQQFDFDIYNDKVYCANGTDSLYSYDFSGLASVATGGTSPQNVRVHKNRLWWVPKNSSTLYFSDAGNPTSFPTNNFIQINTQDGQMITGIEVLVDSLIVFKTDSVWVVVGEPLGAGNTTTIGNLQLRRANSDTGCVAFRTIQKVGNVLMFMGRAGIYVFQNYATQLISQPINNTFRTMNPNFQNLSWAVYSAYEKKYICGYPTAASSTPDQAVMYDLLVKRFTVWDDFAGSCACNFRFSNTDTALMADPTRGIIYQLFQGYVDIAGDNGTATSGSTTTLVDSTKTWTTNQFKDCRVQILQGNGVGQSAVITANTATTLTFAAISVAPDTTSVYTIGGYNSYWRTKVFDFEKPEMTKKYKYWNIFTDSENKYSLKVGYIQGFGGQLSYNQPDVSLSISRYQWDQASIYWDGAGVTYDQTASLYKQVNVGGQERFIQLMFGQNKANQPWRQA